MFQMTKLSGCQILYSALKVALFLRVIGIYHVRSQDAIDNSVCTRVSTGENSYQAVEVKITSRLKYQGDQTFNIDYDIDDDCHCKLLGALTGFDLPGDEDAQRIKVTCSQNNNKSDAKISSDARVILWENIQQEWNTQLLKNVKGTEDGFIIMELDSMSARHPTIINCTVYTSTITDPFPFFDLYMEITGCPAARYGPDCSHECECINGGICHTFTGRCLCPLGFSGGLCQTVSPEVRMKMSPERISLGDAANFTCQVYPKEVNTTTQRWLIGQSSSLPLESKTYVIDDEDGIPIYVMEVLHASEIFQNLITCQVTLQDEKDYHNSVNVSFIACPDNFYGKHCQEVCQCQCDQECNWLKGCITSSRRDSCGSSIGVVEQAIIGCIVIVFLGVLIVLGSLFLRHKYGCQKCGWSTQERSYLDVYLEYREGKREKPNEDIDKLTIVNLDESIFNDWRIEPDDIKKEVQLGKGAFCRVFLGKRSDSFPQNVALKEIKDPADLFAQRDLISEFLTLIDLCPHPNIIQLYGIISFTRENISTLTLVEEYMSHGSLLGLLRETRTAVEAGKEAKATPGKTFLKLVADITSGMSHMASLRAIHRDLAARNILISADMVAKIGDFGLSRDCYLRDYYRLRPQAGKKLPWFWMSPESIKDNQYTTKSDVWSFGILLWEICSLGRTPYTGIEAFKLLEYLENNHRLSIPPSCPQEWGDIMVSCWSWHPDERPSFQELENQFKMLLNENKGFPQFMKHGLV